MKYIFSCAGVVILLFCIDVTGTYFNVPENSLLIVLAFSVLGIVPYLVGFFSKAVQKNALIVIGSVFICSIIINLLITAIEKLPVSYVTILAGNEEKGSFYTLSFFIVFIFILGGTIWQYRTGITNRS